MRSPKTAPSVKLTNGLTSAKNGRRRRATSTIFPHTRRPAGTEKLTTGSSRQLQEQDSSDDVLTNVDQARTRSTSTLL